VTEKKSRARWVGLLGGVVGLVAAGAAAGITLERYVVNRSRQLADDPYVDEPFGQLTAERGMTVRGEDDVDIFVEIIDPPDGEPDLTVIFVHGWCLDMGTFHFQRRYLPGMTDPRLRMIFYDQPGHGRSGRLAAGEYSLEALGRTLHAVMEAAAPTGPLVLVGHSMGGMAIMALAEEYPELFGDRVVGVALIATSAGGLEEVTLGLPDFFARIRRPLMPLLTGASKLTPNMIDRARRVSSDLAWLLTRRYAFGGPQPSPSLVSYVERMNSSTSIEVVAGYLRTLFEHIRYEALAALNGIEVVVVAGGADLLIPLAHSEEICRLLPAAELVVIPEGGHMVLMEFAEEVNAHLAAFLKRAARSAAAINTDEERRTISDL